MRNPIDAVKLRDIGAPVACAVALYELGADVRVAGNVVIATGITADQAVRLSETCRVPVVAYDRDLERRYRKRIIDAAALAAAEDNWFLRREYAREDGRKDPPKPRRISTVFRKHANLLVDLFEEMNHISIGAAYQSSVRQPGRHLGNSEPEEFGHYLYMESAGHGVSLEDYYPQTGFSVPHLEGPYP